MKIVAITSCPAGVAHTNMAAVALERAGKALGHEIKVERQGALGIVNKISLNEAKEADVVIFAVDQKVQNEERFAGKVIHTVPVSAPIKDGKKVIQDALAKLN